MKTARRKKTSPTTVLDEPSMTTFSSDLLTPEEERELLTSFWDCKSELVRILLRQYPHLRANRPPFEPWPMAQFIREYCTDESCADAPATRRIRDKYVQDKSQTVMGLLMTAKDDKLSAYYDYLRIRIRISRSCLLYTSDAADE